MSLQSLPLSQVLDYSLSLYLFPSPRLQYTHKPLGLTLPSHPELHLLLLLSHGSSKVALGKAEVDVIVVQNHFQNLMF